MKRSLSRRLVLALAAAAALPARADLAEVIVRSKASVLPVGTFNATDSPRFGFRGTGFVVGDGNLVATNFHVLPAGAEADSGPVVVVMAGRTGETAQLRRARVVGTDRARDLALLRIEGPPLAPLTLQEGEMAKEGQSIAVMGFPIGGTLGFALVTHRGIIASVTTAALPAATAQQLVPRALGALVRA